MGEEMKVLISETVKGLIKMVNEKKITKDRIVTIIEKGEVIYLIYY